MPSTGNKIGVVSFKFLTGFRATFFNRFVPPDAFAAFFAFIASPENGPNFTRVNRKVRPARLSRGAHACAS